MANGRTGIMFKEKRTFKNSRGLKLSAIYEGKDRDDPVVIICHGYASSKDSQSQQDLRPRLLNVGLSVFTFDFTGCGESQGNLNDLTPIAGIDDLISAVANLDQKNFALVGSSFGGYVALRFAIENSVTTLALKAPVSDWASVKSEEIDSARMQSFLREIASFNIYKRAKNINCPVLITHGDADSVVPLKQSRDLLKSLGSQEKTLKIIKGAPHIMRGKYMQEAHNLIAVFSQETLLN